MEIIAVSVTLKKKEQTQQNNNFHDVKDVVQKTYAWTDTYLYRMTHASDHQVLLKIGKIPDISRNCFVLFFFFYLANKCSKFLFLISDFLFFPVYLFHPNLGSNLNILFFFFLLIPELLRNWAITKWLKAYHNLWKCLTFFFSLPVQYPNHKEQIVVLLVVFFLISDSASFSYFNELTSLCDPLTYNRTIWLNYF